MSSNRIYVDTTDTLTSQGRENILARNGQSRRYCSPDHSPKIPVSITTNQLESSGLIAGENDILEGHEPENKTSKFRRCLLGRTILNWITKCYGQEEVNHKCM